MVTQLKKISDAVLYVQTSRFILGVKAVAVRRMEKSVIRST